jgi:hypothetical protein
MDPSDRNNESPNLDDLLWKKEIRSLNKIFLNPAFQDFVKWLKTDSYDYKNNKEINTDDKESISSFFDDLKDINYLKNDRDTLKEEINSQINIPLLKKFYEDLPENDSSRKRMMSIIFLTWLIKTEWYNIEFWDTLSTLKNSLYSWMKVNFKEWVDLTELNVQKTLNFNLKNDKVIISYRWKNIWEIIFINKSDPFLIKHFIDKTKKEQK